MSGHDHGENHHSHDNHHHDKGHEPGAQEMPMQEKLKKMVAHWLKHNADHAATYRQWAQRARDAGMEDVARVLETVAEDSQAINRDLEKAGEIIEQKY